MQINKLNIGITGKNWAAEGEVHRRSADGSWKYECVFN